MKVLAFIICNIFYWTNVKDESIAYYSDNNNTSSVNTVT